VPPAKKPYGYDQRPDPDTRVVPPGDSPSRVGEPRSKTNTLSAVEVVETATDFFADEAGANRTEIHTSADTAAVAGDAAAVVKSGAQRGQGGFTNTTGSLVGTAAESGGKAVNRLLAKALSSDADNADSVLAGLVRRIALVGATDSSGNIDLAGSAWVNRHLGNVPDTTSRFAAPVPNATSDIGLTGTGGVVVAGNNAAKTSGTNGNWDGQVYSREAYSLGATASVIAKAGQSHTMFGLNTDPTTDAIWSSLDYALYMNQSGSLDCYESGSFVGTLGTWAGGDMLAVMYDGSYVRYLKNGAVLRTVSVAAGLTFYFDSSFYDFSSVLNNIRFTPMTSNAAAHIGGGNLIAGVNESGGKAIARLLAKALAADPDNADSVLFGLIRRIPLLGASDSSGNINLAGTAWVNKHAGNVATRSPTQAGTWSTSGVTLAGSAALVNDGDITSNAWHTDAAVAGAYLQVDMGAATVFGECRVWAATDNGAANYKVRYSSDAIAWTDIATGFVPSRAGVNAITFARTGARYWRLELTNTPGSGPWMNEVELNDPAGAALSNQRGVNIGQLIERIIPFVDVGAILRAAAKESGGKTVARLLAKALAGDADNLDGAPDGTTYKKILGIVSGLATQASNSSRNRCRVKRSAFLSVSASTDTAVGFDTEDFDVGSLHDTSTNNSRITIPTGGGGVPWMFGLTADWANASDATRRKLTLFKNGAELVPGSLVTAVNGDATRHSFFWMDIPADGDWYEMVVWHNSAGPVSLAIGSKFTAVTVW
jgi:hypothetical protein